MFLHSLAWNVEFGPKSIFKTELIKVRLSCIPSLVLWDFDQNKFLGANWWCSMFLHSLAWNVEFGPKSIFTTELIKFWLSCIPSLVLWDLVQNRIFEWIDKGSMFLHSLPCNVEFGPKSSFRIELIKFDVPAFLGFLWENLAKNQFMKQTDKGFMFLYSLACNVEFGPKSIYRSKLIRFDVHAFLCLWCRIWPKINF